jgi:hypothetical protein
MKLSDINLFPKCPNCSEPMINNDCYDCRLTCSSHNSINKCYYRMDTNYTIYWIYHMVPLNNTTLIYYNGALEITIDFLLPFNITKDKINKLMILL